MDASELVENIESAGGKLAVEGDQIVYEIPPTVKLLLTELRAQKPQVIEVLRQRESADYVRAFHGQPHVKLFPFIGRKVKTPAGPGTLLQVFADRVTVILDCELPRCLCFTPGQIEPLSWEP
jgi:hypothetical protein